ncbi:ABC transporter ATP-binding protein [Polymorphobacter sp.]|uniref:ABC transporter ATP-binding protein n=1 Tax=Polymorphobacter sp. TaxID=1909290 RepID=UPI003F6F74E8
MTASPLSAALLSLETVSVTFPVGGGLFRKPQPLQAVRGVSLSVRAGDRIGIVGESGCGKSTLARAALGFVPASEGRVLWRGQDIATLSDPDRRKFRAAVQIIFQNPLASLNPRMTVGDIIAEPLEIFAPELPAAERRARAEQWLVRVGLRADMANRFPSEFSGGQAQRIAIARAMISGPELLICDEAVSALDVSIKAQVINLLKQLSRDTGVALLFISHDLAIVRQIATNVMVMYLGRTMETAPAATLFADPRHPYTQALLSAAPIPDPAAEAARTPIILGTDLPSPLAPPSGCVFRTRCPIAKPNCIRIIPPLTGPDTHQTACHYAGTDLRALAAAQ